MSTYEYRARDRNGNPVRDSVTAESRQLALAALHQRELTVIDLVAAGSVDPPAAAAGTRRAGFSLRTGVSTAEKALLFRQLAVAVNAGVPLLESLEAVGEDLENPVLARLMAGVVRDLHAGRTFSQALADHARIFRTETVEVIKAAEEAGSMARTLDRLATAMERSDRLERRIRTVTAYPLFVGGFFVLICGVMTLFVLPKFRDIFAGFGARLPLLTRVVFGINNYFLDHFVAIFIGMLATVGILYALASTPAGKMYVDGLKYRFPLIGVWLRKYAIARFCRHLAMMLQGGVPIGTALEIAAGICANRVLEAAVRAAQHKIVGGAEIAASLGTEGEFPNLVIRMIHVGETSGRLPEVLDKVSDVYEDQVEGSVTVAMALFEPIVICVFGCVVLILVLAIYMPVFLLASTAK
ncbi:MAG: type II secretion system F family protein [Lentisphaeria bacterium]